MGDELGGVAVVPLILGLVEMAKRLGLGSAWAALLAVGLGLAASLGRAALATPGAPAAELARATLAGVALGLSASGLYSGAKRLAE